ncbi:MAG: acyl-CoA desaturase [Myxococcales bacterium]|nr:acyl-CoA desaturase [Myxococcales bacterium]
MRPDDSNPAPAVVEPAATDAFFPDLKQRVTAFLDEQGLDPIDQRGMVTKAIIIYAMWFASYGLYLFLLHSYGWLALLAVLPLYFSLLCIALAVMHDGSHAAFAHSRLLNRLAAGSMIFAGASAYFWHKGHVQRHHNHTNVNGQDRDFESGGLLRLHPAQPQRTFHRHQHIYAWFLYTMHTLKWIWWDDYFDYATDVFKLNDRSKRTVIKELLICKPWHVLSYIALPLIVSGGNWAVVLVFYVIHFLLMGISLTIVFLMAHLTGVQETCASESEAKPDWALHQLATTANFATGNRALTWVVGGLNFQIEHHIFPKMSHTRHPLIQPLVKEFCRERGVAYYEYPTFGAVLRDHYRNLKQLGTPPPSQVAATAN